MNWYSDYKNINREDFEDIKLILDRIERISSPIMQMDDFYANRINYDEALGLDYLHEDTDFEGNIGLTYDEEQSTTEHKLFRFYILKTYDANGYRFYKKDGLKEFYSIVEVEKKFIQLFKECLDIYNSLKKDELIEKIKLKE
jgi:hypothetical protein